MVSIPCFANHHFPHKGRAVFLPGRFRQCGAIAACVKGYAGKPGQGLFIIQPARHSRKMPPKSSLSRSPIRKKTFKTSKAVSNEQKFIENNVENVQFHYGFPSGALKEIVKYWQVPCYDWRREEAKLNSIPQAQRPRLKGWTFISSM